MPYKDQARYPPLSTVPPPNLNTHFPAAPPSYSFIPFAQQPGFDWFRLQSEEFQLAQQQSFVWFEEFPFLLSNKVLIGAKCTLVCFFNHSTADAQVLYLENFFSFLSLRAAFLFYFSPLQFISLFQAIINHVECHFVFQYLKKVN